MLSECKHLTSAVCCFLLVFQPFSDFICQISYCVLTHSLWGPFVVWWTDFWHILCFCLNIKIWGSCCLSSAHRAPPDWNLFLSRFLVLDLPKIALTGDINGLLLASPWLLQFFGSTRQERRSERKAKWKSSTHHFSEEIASLFDSLPKSAPPAENCPADVVAVRRLQRKEAFMRGTSILGISVSEPRCRPNLSVAENSVLFPARVIFRLKPSSNE